MIPEDNMDIRATVLIDNTAPDTLLAEWGLSIYTNYRGRTVLLDTGQSGGFAENAAKLGADIAAVEYGVLSHAHYDHADGMEEFFSRNATAKFCLREGAMENCYSGEGEDRHYIGIKRGTLNTYRGRILFCGADYQLFEGAWLLPHRRDMTEAGKLAHMYLQDGSGWQIDRFAHEQSLVFDTAKGLVVFNSCCHGGADIVIEEAREALGKDVYALVGGLHLFRSDDGYVLEMAERLRKTGVKRIITGHCTGERGIELLKNALPGCVEEMSSGYVFEI